MFKKYIFPQLSVLFVGFFIAPLFAGAAIADTRADSFNISHYTISLDLSNLVSKNLSGSCELKGVSKIDKLDRLSLELYRLKVDSVVQNGKKIAYLYNDSLLTPKLDHLYNNGDSLDITVYYHGQPAQTTWGGFYWDAAGQYAFNLGVGLYTNPHNFGRIWFPCVDNFTDKAMFSFFIKSQDKHKVYCNGLLIDSTASAQNTLIWHWELRQPVAAYLASVAVGNYKTLYKTFNSKNGNKKIMIGVIPKDSTIALTTFQNLPKILAAYENMYGPYPFDRVGFVGVNFGGGAMEHATNIALPNSAIEGGLTDESLWAHELSHQWWGDMVTCASEADMWLNEGWASFNESMYQELLYGKKACNDYAMNNHYNAIRYAHIVDEADRPLSPMPNAYTYGPTIYKKGADIARTLKGYLGDSLFFIGTRGYMKDFAFKSATSDDFKASLTKSTGVDMKNFFDDWVYTGGWPHFEITQLNHNPDPNKPDEITITRRTVNNTRQYTNTPLEITWYDAAWKPNIVTIKTGTNNWNIAAIPKNAIFMALDMDGKITDATTKQYQVIKKKGAAAVDACLLNLNVDSLKDSALVYVVHNWIGAERTNNTPKNIRISSDRYWTVDGIFPAGFHATATLSYDGRTYPSAYTGGFLDNNFLNGVKEDSIVLMYRAPNGTDWNLLKEGTDYTKTIGNNHTDEFGNIKLMNLKKGKYAFGIYDKRAGIVPLAPKDNGMEVYPNPTANTLHIKFKEDKIINSLQVYDSNGKWIKQINNSYPATNEITISNLNLTMGTYIMQVSTSDGLCSKKFVVE